MKTVFEKGFVSADSHVAEPGDLWVKRVDKRFRDRAPQVESRTDADYFCIDGLPPFANAAFMGAMVSDKVAGPGQVKGVMRRQQEIRPGAWDVQARLADQEMDNVRAEVTYPSVGMQFFAIPDPEYQRECMRVCNDYIAEFCAAAPQRLLGAALLPLRGPIKWAVEEAQRSAQLGLRSVMMPCGNLDRAFNHPYYQPLWAALQEMELPAALHPGGQEQSNSETFGKEILMNAWVVDNKITPMMQGLTGLLASGVPQQYPKLQFVLAEGGIGWIAAALRLMDHWWEDNYQWMEPKLGEKPSFYFHRQCWATFEDDRAGLLTRELLNVDHLMWGSDYPHAEGTFPCSKAQIAKDFAGIPEAELSKIVCENVTRLYGIELS